MSIFSVSICYFMEMKLELLFSQEQVIQISVILYFLLLCATFTQQGQLKQTPTCKYKTHNYTSEEKMCHSATFHAIHVMREPLIQGLKQI